MFKIYGAIVNLDSALALAAAKPSINLRLPMADNIIQTTAGRRVLRADLIFLSSNFVIVTIHATGDAMKNNFGSTTLAGCSDHAAD